MLRRQAELREEHSTPVPPCEAKLHFHSFRLRGRSELPAAKIGRSWGSGSGIASRHL